MTGLADADAFPTFPTPVRLAIAFLIIAAVFLIAQYSAELLDNGSLFILLGIAVMATAWLAGTAPALGAIVVAVVFQTVRADPSAEPAPLHLALFLLHGLLVTAIVAELRRARHDAEDRAAEAQAARTEGESASRLKDEFLATISHELRTPLNAVLGWVHLLRTGKLDQDTACRGLESIDRNVRLQAQMTSDLLDVSKALTGKLQLEPGPTRLDDAARQAVAAMTPAAYAKDVVIEVKLPDASVVVHGDPSRLRQVAWQLLANAIKFSPRGGRVEISVDSAGQDARLLVRDTGPGIDPRFLPRIFERFTQADGSVTRSAGGLGVGLALVRELVELHGGEIEARNRTDGSGAIFMARFPLQAIEPAGAPRPHEGDLRRAADSRPVLEGLRVLVLDQEAEGRDLLRTVLQHRGATVQTAGSVEEALESLEAWRPDVLVSDSQSPDHDSYALIGKVHSLEAERGGRIPALALRSVAPEDEWLRTMLAAVHRDVPKPVEPAVLTAEIARLAGRERRRSQR